MSTLDDLQLGTILIIREEERASPLPLEHTAVDANIIGAVASVEVTQRFANPFDHPIELEYLFPLPHEAAIVDYSITIGERTISADLKEREKAKQVYQEAVAEGKRASLLEQRRPNLFSIQIGNVQPAEKIVTKILFEDRLHYRDGVYEFIFLMGITPRYHDPAHISQDEAKSVDAPVTLDENKVGPVEIRVNIDAGVSISQPESRTHPISVESKNEHTFSLQLAENTIPNKDFVLQYEASTDDLRTALWSAKDEADAADTVMLTILPPRLDMERPQQQREFIFVIDRSGSMGGVNGGPMVQARNALSACLRGLDENDTFAILAFDDRMEWFKKKPLSVSQKNVEKADAWLETIDSRGGTNIITAIEEALAIPADSKRQRYVVFLTDGSVSADEKAISDINQKCGDARVFTFGIGPSVNRYLLNKMAQMGRGVAEFMGVQDDIETTITRFQDRVSYPALQNIKLKWENADSWDTYPDVLPDLYVGEPLEIVTRLKRQGEVMLHIIGDVDDEAVELAVPVPIATDNNPTLKRIWARARIESLMDQKQNRGLAEKLREQIIAVALDHRIATQYTSFVAVDSEVVDTEGSEKVKVSVPLPEGLDIEGFYGGPPMAAGAAPMMLSAPQSVAHYAPTSSMRAARKTSSGVLGALGGLVGGAVESVARLGRSKSDDIEDRLDRYEATESFSEAAELAFEDADIPRHLRRKSPSQPSHSFNSIDERIKWLARTQNVNGSWDDDVERTSAALLAFVRAGHTTREGNYRRQVHKAATWLSGQLDKADEFALFIAVKALDELHTASGDFAVPDDLRAVMRDMLHFSELPDEATTLDELRTMAFYLGEASADKNLRSGKNQDLVETWLAVGKA